MDEAGRQQVPLAEYPSETVTLACGRCDRRGRYPKAALIERHGAGIGLVTLLNYLSWACRQSLRDPWGSTACRAFYVELEAGSRTPAEREVSRET
ncbi:MAG: hypothetical protein ABS78_09395 [Phenylobacterium sp. SCN 70-31]|nr:MAG: hypothetical protein ABS78_09395 [Phenylobacterium sp. SCN 70-31]